MIHDAPPYIRRLAKKKEKQMLPNQGTPSTQCAVQPPLSDAGCESAAASTADTDVRDTNACEKEDRLMGTLKSFNENTGYGFICCAAASEKYGRDVFINRQEYDAAGCPVVGSSLTFAVLTNDDGRPQAAHVIKDGIDIPSPTDFNGQIVSDYDRVRALRKQVEWYFSDANLSTDEFFYRKISADMDGWLSVMWLLRCRKIKDLNASAQSICQSLESSHLECKTFCSCCPCLNLQEHLYIRRKQPLPPFVGKEHRSAQGKVIRSPEESNSFIDPHLTNNRLKDQRRVQDTLGLKEVGDETVIFREVSTADSGAESLGPIIAYGYERVIYGDHGPYIEFNQEQVNWSSWPHFYDKSRFGDLRFYDEYFTARSWGLWNKQWSQNSSVKGVLMLYAQTQNVDQRPWAPACGSSDRIAPHRESGYADYRKGCFYVAADRELVKIERRQDSVAKPPSLNGVEKPDEQFTAAAKDAYQAFLNQQQAAMNNICWSWAQGYCWKGDNCSWSHDVHGYVGQ